MTENRASEGQASAELSAQDRTHIWSALRHQATVADDAIRAQLRVGRRLDDPQQVADAARRDGLIELAGRVRDSSSLALEPEAREEPSRGVRIATQVAQEWDKGNLTQEEASERGKELAAAEAREEPKHGLIEDYTAVQAPDWPEINRKLAAREVTDAEQCMLVLSASWDATGHQPLPRYVGPFPDRDAAFRWVRHHAPLSGEFNSSPWPTRPEEVSRG